MISLNTESILANRSEWEKLGIELPRFDIAAVRAKTAEAPEWVHFGAGNIFRGYIANLQQNLLDNGLAETGIIATDTFDFEMIEKAYHAFDDLSLLVHLLPDGSTQKKVIASVADAVCADTSDSESFGRLLKIFESKSLKMFSFTITEKGYALTDLNGNELPIVTQDLANGPEKAHHAMSVVTALLWHRFNHGAYPVAAVSMDNCSHNGEKLRSSVLTVAKKWAENGFVSAEFVAWVENEDCVSFPWSMIDKITPRPSEKIAEMLEADGIGGMHPFVTNRNSYTAAFVNAEAPQYLVVEDRFPNGRPALEKAGVYFTDRDTVNDTERMKVTTCLNPLHTALAVHGCLLGYTKIADEMKDADLKKLVEVIGLREGLPVVTDPGIISPESFIREVLEQRLPNVFMPDAPQRIATDTSMKLPIRFGETIKSYMASDKFDTATLVGIPLAIAGWCRYLLGVDDKLQPMEVSADPMLPELQKMLAGIVPGETKEIGDVLRPILSNPVLFATDLYAAGLGEKIEKMFTEMLAGEGAVRATLQRYLAEIPAAAL